MESRIRRPGVILGWKGVGFSLLLALTLFVLGAGIALAEEGTIRGKVTNLTGGAKALPNQEVTLHRVGEKSEDVTLKTYTDAQGNFEFKGLVTASLYKYYVALTYQDANYTSEKVSLVQGETSKEINLSVSDTTTSDKDISFDIEHILVDVGDGQMMINEIMVVRNSGDKAYVGSREIQAGKKETLRFYLPAGATEFAPRDGFEKQSVVKTKEGFSYTGPVPPGTKNMAFMYHFNFDSPRFSFSKKLSYKAQKLFVLVLNTKAQVEVKGLKAGGLVDIQKKSYWSFQGDNLQRGSTFTTSFKGLNKGSNNSLILWVSVVFMLGLIGVMAGYALLRDRLRKGILKKKETDPRDLLRQERRDLLTAIAELDDRFASGAVPRDSYHSERERKKSRLVEIMKELQGKRVAQEQE
jgi:hypothetical protein